MEILIIIWVFILWTIFWSLWSVLLTRLDENTTWTTIKGILFWFSQCPHCKHRLHAQNLIPIVSYISQHGKCVFCKKSISPIYPILEIASWAVFLLSYYLVYNTLSYLIPDWYKLSTLIFRFFTNWTLLLLIVYDFKHYELHMPTRILSAVRIIWRQFLGLQWNYQRAIAWSLIFWVVFIWIYKVWKRYSQKVYQQEEGFGQWDVYMWFLLWALMPQISWYNLISLNIQNNIKIIILFLVISSILGIVYYGINHLINIKLKKEQAKFKIIPFIPSLIIAFWILLFYADRIVAFVFN